jgi:CheY-like chemotaxis protein/HPt (histidine-containing phosphotransfer) domain-containing protein
MSFAELRFLAVEDHEFQRGVLLRILAGLGADHVSVAADGREALQIAMAPDARVDIIISDLDMPGMDGLELMRHLGEAGVAARIILVSALGDLLLASAETMSKEYGVDILGVVEKPLTPAKLDALIRRHMGEQPGHTTPAAAAHPPSVRRVVEVLKKSMNQWLRLPGSARPLDPALLAAISGGDAASERRILEEFRQANDRDAALLKLAVGRRDSAQVTHACERIEGTSRTIGAIALAAACGRLERASCAGDWQALAANMNAFERELERLNAFCEEVASNRPAAQGADVSPR